MWVVTSVSQNKNDISNVIKQTGFAIRDWLGPFYTLGGVIAFAITMLTLLDPSGMLVKSITVVLVVATAIAWAISMTPSRRRSADNADPANQAPPVHALLMAVTLFFTAGLAISEAIMSGKRPAVAPAAPFTQSPPAHLAAPLTPPTAVPPTATASAVNAAGAPAPVAVATSPVAMAPTTSAKPSVSATQTKPVKKPEDHANPSTSVPRADGTSTVAKHAPLSAGDAQRCSDLIAKFSLGHTPSDADKHYLETSCR